MRKRNERVDGIYNQLKTVWISSADAEGTSGSEYTTEDTGPTICTRDQWTKGFPRSVIWPITCPFKIMVLLLFPWNVFKRDRQYQVQKFIGCMTLLPHLERRFVRPSHILTH